MVYQFVMRFGIEGFSEIGGRERLDLQLLDRVFWVVACGGHAGEDGHDG